MAASRTIVAMGGGGFSMQPDNGQLDAFVLGLARSRSGRERPRICWIGTAGADNERDIAAFHKTFDERAETSHLALFARTVTDIDVFLLGQDAIYVGGGNTANMLAIWRLHGVDTALRTAWEAGVLMTGMSAGAICWFETCTTDSFGPELRPLSGALGFLGGSFCPHYDGEAQRRPLFKRLVGDRTLPAGYGVDDGAALVFEGTDLREAVSSLREARAYRVELVDGNVAETPLAVRQLED